jgi:hypothetical protein
MFQNGRDAVSSRMMATTTPVMVTSADASGGRWGMFELSAPERVR